MHIAVSDPTNRAERRAGRVAPITVTVDDCRRMTGLGRSKIYLLIAEGTLKTTTVGKRRLIFVASIHDLLASGQ